MKKFPCSCCGYKTLDHPPNGSFDICEVCYWEDDQTQQNNPKLAGGANLISLKEAQQNFQAFGASDRKFLDVVRSPAINENRNNDWKAL